MNASWPLVQAGGAEIRAHWTVLLVPFLVFGVLVKCGFAPLSAGVWAVPWTVAFYAGVAAHELAHVAVARRFGAAPRTLMLSINGALAHRESRMPTPGKELLMALAGPVAQAMWSLALAIPYLLLGVGEAAAMGTSWFGWAEAYQALFVWHLALSAINLLPCWPMDGARVVRAILWWRSKPQQASMWTAWFGMGLSITICMIGGAVLVGFAGPTALVRMGGLLLILTGILTFAESRSLLGEFQRAAVPHVAVETWRHGRSEDHFHDSIAESERLSHAEDRRERREAEARRHEEAQRRKIQERIDQLLDRINEVGGVENLTAAERRELADASEMLRREPVEH